MLGTIVNCCAIIGGCIVGLFIKDKMTDKISQTIMNGLALCVLYIGISGALEGENTLMTIVCMAIGALIGELIDIDKLIIKLGDKIESKFKKEDENNKISISQGFVSATLLFCVGAMAIVGSLQSGLSNNHEVLFAKSIIDGIVSIIFATSLGIGVIFSSISVFLYQGAITLGASFLSGILSDSVINLMSATGSLVIIGLGLNMLKVTNIKIANLLPSVFLPIFFTILNII